MNSINRARSATRSCRKRANTGNATSTTTYDKSLVGSSTSSYAARYSPVAAAPNHSPTI